MLRRLTILLLIVGCAFADTIKWKRTYGDVVEILDVKFLYTKYGRVYYSEINGKRDWVICSKILSITDNNGNDIDSDCGDKSNTINEEEIKVESSNDVQSIIQNTQKPLVGGIFIAIGGGMLISQNEKDYEDIDDFDESKTTTTIAYALITIGGVLIAIGI